MLTKQQLQVIAGAVGEMMARAGSCANPTISVTEGTAMVAKVALAGPVAHFDVTTPFGDEVCVTVSRAGGMFG